MEIQNNQHLYGQFEFLQASYTQKNESQISRYADGRTVQKSTFEASLTIFQQDVQVYSARELKDQGESLYSASSSTRMFTLDISITRETSLYSPGNSATGGFDRGGYWGVDKTADRIAKFVTNGAGQSLNRLRQGREGIVQGLKEAENLWGGKLPEISYETIKKALETVDRQIRDMGGSVFDLTI